MEPFQADNFQLNWTQKFPSRENLYSERLSNSLKTCPRSLQSYKSHLPSNKPSTKNSSNARTKATFSRRQSCVFQDLRNVSEVQNKEALLNPGPAKHISATTVTSMANSTKNVHSVQSDNQ
ncbi:hypothetical protein Tco_0128997 [Tanacetum coccineum]